MGSIRPMYPNEPTHLCIFLAQCNLAHCQRKPKPLLAEVGTDVEDAFRTPKAELSTRSICYRAAPRVEGTYQQYAVTVSCSWESPAGAQALAMMPCKDFGPDCDAWQAGL